MMRASRKPSEASPQRIASLAKLPVFLDLAGKRAVVAGGTAAAAWKAELLAAAGARVAVYAAELCAEMQALIERQSAAGHIAHIAAGWSNDALADAAVAVADIDRGDLAQRLQDAREDVADASTDSAKQKAQEYLDQLTTLHGAILPA